MSNTITVITELCAEDRARIDRLTVALEARTAQVERILAREAEDDQPDDIQQALAEQVAKSTKAPTQSPVEPAGATEAETPATPQPEAETPAAAEPAPVAAPVAKETPAPTLAELQQKVIALVNKGKKPEVTAIVHDYATAVSKVPEDKRAECMGRLIALEG